MVAMYLRVCALIQLCCSSIFSILITPQIKVLRAAQGACIEYANRIAGAMVLEFLPWKKKHSLPVCSQPLAPTIEEGGRPDRRQRRELRQQAARATAKWVQKLVGSCVLFCGAGLVYYACVAFGREMVFDEMDKRISEIGAVCLAPVNIGHASALHYVSFGKNSKYPRMVSPEVVSLAGKEVVSSEQSTLCNGNGPVDRLRHEVATVMFKSHPLMTNETAIVFGAESICLQHMIGIFTGHDPCEEHPHIHKRKKNNKNSNVEL